MHCGAVTGPHPPESASADMGVHVGQCGAHDRGQVLPAGLPSHDPDLLEHLHRVIAIRRRSRLAHLHTGRAPPLEGPAQLPPGIRPRPAHLRHQPVQDLALGLLRRRHIRAGFLLSDFPARRQRQPIHPSSTPKHPTMHQRFREHFPNERASAAARRGCRKSLLTHLASGESDGSAG